MTEKAANTVFAITWLILVAVAMVMALFSVGRPEKRRAGIIADLLVISPFLLVFGLFYLRPYAGSYEGCAASRLIGGGFTLIGLLFYLVSHLYLRLNWSLSASIRQGHRLVTAGPYCLVRHPMYSSMTLIVLGSGLLTDNYLMIASTVLIALVYYVRAGKEEKLLRQEFPEFVEYASKVKMFIPLVF